MQSISRRNLYLAISTVIPMLPSMTNAAAPAKPGAKLEEVTVTARRREESAQETPVALSVLNAEQLYTAGIKEIRDLTRSEEHTSELQSRENLVCRLLLEKKKK